ncbi:HD domain-containing protein [Lachnospiraceae bacterium OttesenSCG-928-D06]|nr:HD domain-containing protein [Lachnospiraceae bacterium OttesenSCG-928-D06]
MKDIFSGDKADLVRLLIDNTPVAYIIMDDLYQIHYINENFLKLRNLQKETTIGETCYNISNGGVHCKQCAVEQALCSNKKAMISRKDIMGDGSVRFIDDYAIPLGKKTKEGRQYILEIMVNRTPEMLLREQKEADYGEILSILSILLEAKDTYTASHSESVRVVATKLARAMMLSEKEVAEISIAASLHDIGKVHIPWSIINKPGKLDDEEFALIKSHPVKSYEMLEHLSSFHTAKKIARHHHERVDGKGYPDGLKGDEISLGARIVAVADTYDAITSTRSYRKGLSHEYALEEIARVAGTQLDKDVVEAFLKMDFNAEEVNNKEEKEKTVERKIEAGSSTQVKPSDFNAEDLLKMVDENLLLHEILKNTPCGYVFMDTNRKVLFASDYFLEYMGLTEEDALDKPCYEAGGISSVPCPDCALERAMKSGQVEYMRQEQYTNNGRKIFDLFGMPLKNKDDSIDYVIEVIIDRTKEVLSQQKREEDFNQLIDMLSDLLNTHKEFAERTLSPEIMELRKRLNELILKKKTILNK